jgi:glycosyltransferase involved in cell wall biosynthesis
LPETHDLFVGITTSNSSRFIGCCLDALRERTRGVRLRAVVLDNYSADDTVAIAERKGAAVVLKACNQPDAMNALLRKSRSPFTLLMHADTVILGDDWFELCAAKAEHHALVSPEDIGCGPFSRPFGAGMPESSFLFFNTRMIRKALDWRVVRRFRLPIPRRALDLYADHVTHRLPARLQRSGLRWFPMSVHVSDRVESPIYQPLVPDIPLNWVWNESLAYYRYGLGNFYSIDGKITHYHNWYERIRADVPDDSLDTTTGNSARGFPLAYVKAYTNSFLDDLQHHRVRLPQPTPHRCEPKLL